MATRISTFERCLSFHGNNTSKFRIKPFVKQANNKDTAVTCAVKNTKKEIYRQFRFFGITDSDSKRDGLLIHGGQDLLDIDDALFDPTSEESDDAYKVLIWKIDQNFIPKQNQDIAIDFNSVNSNKIYI